MILLAERKRLAVGIGDEFSGGETLARLPPLLMLPQTQTRRLGSAKGSGCSNTAFTRLKIAVLAPMPKARASKAIAVNPGRFDRLLIP